MSRLKVTKNIYHVYADDGYESAHATEQAALRAAVRGACRRRVPYRVVRVNVYRLTGGGHGSLVARVTAAGEVVVGEEEVRS